MNIDTSNVSSCSQSRPRLCRAGWYAAAFRRRFFRSLWQGGVTWLTVAASVCAWYPLLATGATFRWSPSVNSIFVEDGGSATLSDIKAALPSAPLDLVDPANKIWLLRADLFIRDGCILVLHGAAAGGDVNEFRLQSLNTVAAGSVVSVQADYGTLDISDTKILSWDTGSDGPDMEYLNFGRAHIMVRSSLSTNGVTALESRMDITRSEIAYLGYPASDSFGLVWKVGGADPTPTNSIFDVVNVYGNVAHCHIHDNYDGIYTLGVSGMVCSSNEINANVQYGLDLQDDSDAVVIRGNNIHHNGNHGLQASDRCDHLTVQDNVSRFNAQSGILLSRNSDDSVIENNECSDNGENGLVLSACSRETVRGNTLARNLRAGLQLDLGSADNLIADNLTSSNTFSGIVLLKGSGEPAPGDDGRPKRNTFTGNRIEDNAGDPVDLTDGDDNLFATNSVRAVGTKLRFKRGLRNTLDGNTIPADVAIRTESDTNGIASTFVRNQPLFRTELNTNGTVTVQDSLGRIFLPDENALLTEISSNGSSLTLTFPQIGGSSTVVARNFYVSAAPGSAFLNNLVWEPASRTQWSVAAGSAGQTLEFRLGDLVAGTNYVVRKGKTAITNLNTDVSGQLQFTDTAATTDPVTYSVEILNTSPAGYQYSAALNKISIKGGASATLSDIKAALPDAPLDLVDAVNEIWLLRADLQVQDGGTLVLHGLGAGGDVNELRLLSLDSGATNGVVSVTADWGFLDIDSTKIISWNTESGGPDTNDLAFGRAYVRVRSSLSTNGMPLESRMDIRNSEIAYLGYNDPDSYGLVWKVGGADPTPTNSIYDLVNVYGNVVNCHLHDNYIGAYAAGAMAMQWQTNEVDHNEQYGLDLQSDSDQAAIQGNNIHHNGNNGLLASARCDHLQVEGNLCWSNLQSGIVLDRASDNAVIEANQCLNNADSGIVLSASSANEVRNNTLLGNLEAGLRLSLGSADNAIENNQSASNGMYGIQCQMGSGTPNAGDDGRPKRNTFTANGVHDNGVEPVRLADSDDNVFAGNTFSDSTGKLRFQRSLRNQLDGNALPEGLSVRTEGDTNAVASTLIRNQSLVKVELGVNSSVAFQDVDGRIYQPDEGAVPTALSSDGSSLTLTPSQIGGSSMVIARNFYASVAPGTALVQHLVWTNGTRRQWSVTTDAPGRNLSFTIGDLIASTNYVVRKGTAALVNLTTDISGQLQFADTAATTNTVDYSIDLASDALPNLDPSRPPGSNFDLSHWRLTLPDANATDVVPADLVAGYTDPPYFYTDVDGAMKFWCPVTGGTTQGSDFPRSELREMVDPIDTGVNWTAYGTNRLDALCRVTQIPERKRVIIGQIHSYTVGIFPLLKLEFVDGALEAKLKVSPNDSTNETKYTFGNVGLSNLIAYRLELVDGIVSVTVNGVTQSANIFDNDPAWTNQTFFFKAGSYCQDNDGPDTEGSAVSFYQLSASHSSVPGTAPLLAATADLSVGTGNRLVLTWSAPAPDWVLQESPTLEAPVWTNSTNDVQSLPGQQYQVMIPATSRGAFFRLMRP